MLRNLSLIAWAVIVCALLAALPARADVMLPGTSCSGSQNFNGNNGILTCNGSSYAANPTFIGTSASAPYTCSGTTYLGMIYYDTTAGALKNCTSSGWTIVGGVNSFSAGTTGLTPGSATTGAITLAGTLGVPNGGTGLTALTSNVIYKGNGTGNLAASGLTDSGTLISSSENVDVTSKAVLMEITNTSATVNHLAKLNTSGAAIIPLTTDTDGMVGIVIGTSGSVAQIAIDGQASCTFDGTTTAGDFVTVSSSVAGDCTDYGSSRPGGQSIGRVLTVNSGSGTTATVALGLSAPGGGVPNGTIAAFASLTCPSGWTEYTASRGLFLRGYDNSAGIDPSGNRAVGNVQQDAFQAHQHNVANTNPSGLDNPYNVSGGRFSAPAAAVTTGYVSDGTNGTPRTSTETRPKNIVVMFCQYTGGSPIIGATATGGATNYVARWTSGTVIGTGIIYDNGSAVGIGTTSTGALLNVNGGVSIGTSYVGTAAPTNGAIIQGNVGIGTTGPNYLLHVNGSAAATTLFGTTATTVAGDTLYYGTTGQNFFMDRPGASGGQIILGYNTAKVVGGESVLQIYNNSTDRNMLFNVVSAGTSSGTNYEYLSGNVGIGSTAPNTNLHVYGATNNNYGQLEVESSGADARISLYNSGTSYPASSTTRGDINMSATSGYQGMRFMINNVDEMIIGSSGNVGIGTTSPSYLLEMDQSTTANNEAAIINTGGSRTGGTNLILVNDAAASSAYWYIGGASGGSNFLFHVDGAGNEYAVSNNQSSDVRLKTAINPLADRSGLDAIEKLRPVSFKWKDTGPGTQSNLGFIAQQMRQVFPQLVTRGAPTNLTPDGALAINYTGLIAPLVKAVQQLKSENDSLRTANDAEAAQIKTLTARLDALEATRH